MLETLGVLISVLLGILIGGTLASVLAIASAKNLISQLPWKQERNGGKKQTGVA
tara:strand:- start:444 stop:605 length:162 start_codon:yes stop_codon:yes gene_type:complete